MVPGGAPGSASGRNAHEGDLKTSSLEQRTRTFDAVPSAPAGPSGAGPAPGDVLANRFVLHQCLADGATRLFRALDRRRATAGDPAPWVVLKVVTTPKGRAPGEPESRALQALRREAAVAKGLDHPNLPRIFGIDQDGPHTFVCMAWLEGESLAAILDSRGTRPMTRVQAVHILDGVGRALTHLHAQGITHADVKPGNILVTAEGHATLLDFGVAVGRGTAALPAVRGFTPEYASPEVLDGSEPTPADDLFSLGCVAYRMLAGHRAFGASTAREAAAAGTHPARPANLSPAQWRAIERALAFGRADRQPDVASFLAQLKVARDEMLAVTDLAEPEQESSIAPAMRVAAPAMDLRNLLRPAAVVLTLAVGGVLTTLWLRSPDSEPEPMADAPPALPSAPVADGLAASSGLPSPAAAPIPAPAASPAVPPLPVAAAPPVATVAAPKERPRAAPLPRSQARNRKPPPELAGPPLPDPAVDTPPAPVVEQGAPTAASAAVSGRTVAFSDLKVRRYVEPTYPRNAASRRLAGWVDVAFTVEPSGRTADVRVLGAEPPDTFDDAALAAVRRWRFDDLDDDAGGPVSSQIRVRFDPR